MDTGSERFWQAVEARDPRFDGWVFAGVKTTGIYCRPSCPARTPKRENVRFYATAAAAQGAGFRACKRCRPDATPGSPEWDLRADMVGRAMRLIADGVVDREGVVGLASRLGYTERHVHRQLVAVVGAGPLALARAQRAQTARILLETTDVSITDVAFAAGFRSVRQFNATVQEVFALAPRALRARALRYGRSEDSGAISLRLPYRAPFDAAGTIAFLALRAVPGVEEACAGVYRRSLLLPNGPGAVELKPAEGCVRARFLLSDLRDLAAAMQRSRALLDLDSDPHSVLDALGADRLLGPLVRGAPGRRVPGTVDGHELAVRAVLGQQVSVKGARTLAGRLVARYGEPLERPLGAVTHAFPTAQALVRADARQLAMPVARRRALLGLVSALARGEVAVDAGADRVETRRRLLALPGVGPWTAEYVAMRALRDPDAFIASDLGVRHALERLGRTAQAARPAEVEALAERWRPYRAYAVAHLWASLAAPEQEREPEPKSAPQRRRRRPPDGRPRPARQRVPRAA
ncbi:MAG TPA: Ada metal-binding domain-containing protein [Solirubrobacteraceae bacterium]|jgi:AraC family transcriptional regulator of adaptative response / DNA-3-methyladenine glycosylase II|nr:Ada metal-binding domain-containing protein [Solirubrobacteraceae bacterium]